ncbi:MAG: DNA replication/repair protein RecF [Ruminococcaceae bacterium]|nr:DNA replication/repair protein RecF [Oscillospiraceae bacterium]
MIVKSLTVVNFRNYEREHIELGSGTNVIYGNNAQGKTNLLEAVHLFASGKSHRTKTDRELIRFGEKYMKVCIEFSDKDRDYKAIMQIGADLKKSVKINNVPITKLSMLMRYLNVVMFSPEDLEIIKGAPQMRRRFLDEAISQLYPAYLKSLISYHKNLAQKNALLKKLKFAGKMDDATLSVWNEQIAEDGYRIMLYRKEYIEKLSSFAGKIHKEISGEILNLLYTPSIDCDIIDKEKFLLKLESAKEREIENGASLYGIQRDDIRFFINDNEVRTYASQGQQRTTVLSLKMAQMDYIKEVRDEFPVLLLDDIMSELDTTRRTYLANRIKGKQVIITCTDSDMVETGESTKLFKVEKGKILT